MKLIPEDPSTFEAVKLLETKHFEVWNVPQMLPRDEDGLNGLHYINGALNHLCKTGSIRHIEWEDDQDETNLH